MASSKTKKKVKEYVKDLQKGLEVDIENLESQIKDLKSVAQEQRNTIKGLEEDKKKLKLENKKLRTQVKSGSIYRITEIIDDAFPHLKDLNTALALIRDILIKEGNTATGAIDATMKDDEHQKAHQTWDWHEYKYIWLKYEEGYFSNTKKVPNDKELNEMVKHLKRSVNGVKSKISNLIQLLKVGAVKNKEDYRELAQKGGLCNPYRKTLKKEKKETQVATEQTPKEQPEHVDIVVDPPNQEIHDEFPDLFSGTETGTKPEDVKSNG